MNTNKTCEKCNLTVTYKNWARHLGTQKHLRNDPDQTLKPRREKKSTPKVNQINLNTPRKNVQMMLHGKNSFQRPKSMVLKDAQN